MCNLLEHEQGFNPSSLFRLKKRRQFDTGFCCARVQRSSWCLDVTGASLKLLVHSFIPSDSHRLSVSNFSEMTHVPKTL